MASQEKCNDDSQMNEVTDDKASAKGEMTMRADYDKPRQEDDGKKGSKHSQKEEVKGGKNESRERSIESETRVGVQCGYT